MMSEAEFLAGVTGSPDDFPRAVAALKDCGQPFCLISGLAVNHYAEPMVTLDADFAIATAGRVEQSLRAAGFETEGFPHSINAQLPGSRLRIQITINSRYGAFPARAVTGRVFGVEMPVACLQDVVQGKIWAVSDATRRRSKRAKDEADLIRLAESHPGVFELVPHGLVPGLDEIRPTH